MQAALGSWRQPIQRSLTKAFGRLHAIRPEIISSTYELIYADRNRQDGRPVCLFSVVSPVPIRWLGKMRSRTFLRSFCFELSCLGYNVEFACSEWEIEEHLSRNQEVVLVNIIGEDTFAVSSSRLASLEERFSVVFNRSKSGLIIADKLRTQQVLSGLGVPMPELSTRASNGFVRSRLGTHLPVGFVSGAHTSDEIEDPMAIVNEFVDTTVSYRNEAYYTSVRLLCINAIVVHAYVRARSLRNGNPSVHAADTPLDPNLIEYLQETMIAPNMGSFLDIAVKVHKAFGDGFFAHDLLVERDSGRVLLCETGFKFDDYNFWAHILPIQEFVPSHAVFFPPGEYAKRAARTFVAEIKKSIV